jgi:hypothetical protein
MIRSAGYSEFGSEQEILRKSGEKGDIDSLYPIPRSLAFPLRTVARASSGMTSDVARHFLTLATVFAALLLMAGAAVASTSIPGENHSGFFHTITHLHAAAYFILFLIFVLSVMNLVFQGWISVRTWPISFVFRLFDRFVSTGPAPSGIKGVRRTGPRNVVKSRPESTSPAEDGIVSIRRILNTKDSVSQVRTPTPLDGVNHPIPSFASTIASHTGAPRILDSQPVKKASSSEFRFSSAVDLPSTEEMERREKEQLVVSGSVKDLEGNGIASVIVYLTDEEGNRIGQSCRTAQNTGEFKVLINEPGKYILNGYKRGFIMESRDPLALPIESGKIEGFNFRMIPEGCLVQGRVITEPGGRPLPGYEVKCFCGNRDFLRSTLTGAAGEFRIPGVLLNSKCFIEICGEDGAPIAQSDPFETVQKKEIYREMVIPTEPELEDDADAEESAADTVDSDDSPDSATSRSTSATFT